MTGFGFTDTYLPLGLLVALALLLPLIVVPRATRSQGRLAGGMVTTAFLTLLFGAGLFAALYGLAGNAVGAGFAADPGGTVLAFLGRSALAALGWGPLWALAWLVRAQGVEKRRGEDMARGANGRG